MTDREKIRAEVERHKEHIGIGLNAYDAGYENGRFELCNDLLFFIDSLPEETNQNPSPDEAMKLLDEKIALRKKAGSWENPNSLDEIRGKEPEGEKWLDDEVERFHHDYFDELHSNMSTRDIVQLIAAHFTEWQKRQDRMKCHGCFDRDDIFRKGMMEMRRRMMAEAVECDVKVDAGGYPYICGVELYDYDNDIPLAKQGDKVKVVIIKSDEQ